MRNGKIISRSKGILRSNGSLSFWGKQKRIREKRREGEKEEEEEEKRRRKKGEKKIKGMEV